MTSLPGGQKMPGVGDLLLHHPFRTKLSVLELILQNKPSSSGFILSSLGKLFSSSVPHFGHCNTLTTFDLMQRGLR